MQTTFQTLFSHSAEGRRHEAVDDNCPAVLSHQCDKVRVSPKRVHVVPQPVQSRGKVQQGQVGRCPVSSPRPPERAQAELQGDDDGGGNDGQDGTVEGTARARGEGEGVAMDKHQHGKAQRKEGGRSTWQRKTNTVLELRHNVLVCRYKKRQTGNYTNYEYICIRGLSRKSSQSWYRAVVLDFFYNKRSLTLNFCF